MPNRPVRHVTETEARLETLYALELLGSSTNLQLLEFMVENDLMNYFDLQLALLAMRDGGQALREGAGETERYIMTAAGREALFLFGNRIPATARRVIEISAPAWREHFQKIEVLTASTDKNEHGGYTATLKIVEQGVPMMTITLALPTQQLASLVQSRWSQKGGDVYQYVMRAMADEGRS